MDYWNVDLEVDRPVLILVMRPEGPRILPLVSDVRKTTDRTLDEMRLRLKLEGRDS
jgi:hypothetical protein